MIDFDSIANIASILGFIISFITMIYATIIDRKVKNLQLKNLFDKRINSHLKNIDLLQQNFSSYTSDIVLNETEIKNILVDLLTEFESINQKLTDKKTRHKVFLLISIINKAKKKSFYEANCINIRDKFVLFYNSLFLDKIPSNKIKYIYTLVNENYDRIQHVKLDNKALIK